MIYMRGQAQDYDNWRRKGLVGWGWADVLPHFLRHQDHVAPIGEHHRSGGEYRVEHPRVRWDILDAIRQAGEQAGVPAVEDFNGGDNAGSSYFQVNQRAGRRWSTATAFLKPVLKRGNLRLETSVDVERLVMDGRRIVSVRAARGGRVLTARVAGEVILAAGAVGSPLILQRSGVGDAERLKRAGVAVRHHLPGVGANLQDHLQIRPIYKVSGVRTLNTDYANLARRFGMGVDYVLRRSGPLTMAPSQLGMFCRSDPSFATPNLQFHFQPLSLDKWGDGLHRFGAVTASVCNLRPTSRGRVALSGPSLAEPPLIDPQYLTTPEDRRIAVDSLRWARRIMSQAALARYAPQEFRPGAGVDTDDELLAAAKALATTIFHQVGTVAMGPADDPLSVLDERLRVRGLQGLRVVDASVMPAITSGNTNAPTVMIAEKGAAMILEDRRSFNAR
ncbi:GMC family oxidoreductase [soil metagenome]